MTGSILCTASSVIQLTPANPISSHWKRKEGGVPFSAFSGVWRRHLDVLEELATVLDCSPDWRGQTQQVNSWYQPLLMSQEQRTKNGLEFLEYTPMVRVNIRKIGGPKEGKAYTCTIIRTVVKTDDLNFPSAWWVFRGWTSVEKWRSFHGCDSQLSQYRLKILHWRGRKEYLTVVLPWVLVMDVFLLTWYLTHRGVTKNTLANKEGHLCSGLDPTTNTLSLS